MMPRFRHSYRFHQLLDILLLVLLLSGCALTGRNPASPENSQSTSPAITSPADTLPGAPRLVKISTTEEGIHELTPADLAKVGINVKALDPTRLQLFNRGRQVPLWSSEEVSNSKTRSGSLYFFAQASPSRYTSKNVYWLIQDASPAEDGIWSLKVPEQELIQHQEALTTTSELPADTYFASTILEQNKLYMPQVAQGDHWLWLSMAAPHDQMLDVDLKNLVAGPGRIRVALWARTEAPVDPDHHLVLSVNGQTVADQSWDGIGRILLDASIPQGILKAGANQVGLQLVSVEGVPANIVVLDWIEIGYPRKLTPEADRLDFTSTGGTHPLTGFSGRVGIFDVSDRSNPSLVSFQDGRKGTFEGIAGHHYLVVGPKGFRQPDSLAPAVSTPDLRATGEGADYVAIGPPDLLAPLQPLLALRQQEGLKVASVPLEAVYDQFYAGVPEPEAIRAFMQYAARSWQPAPHYLLLVGDATYDPLGYQAPPEANRLPVFLVSTIYGGETASDVGYAQLDQDAKPDLAVGRIPADHPGQVSTLVEKILTFETEKRSQATPPQLLAVADGQAPIFRDDAQSFLDLFPANFQSELLAPPAGASGIDQQILERLQQGDLLVAYFGHGSINMWGKDRLLTTEDVAKMTNAKRLPVVFNMTCLNGLFTHPEIESMAEALLWQPGGGAAAVLAPTSLTLPTDQSFLYKPLVQAMLEDPSGSLGDFLLQARRQVPTDSPGRRDVMETFLLFGDPAMKLMPAGE